GCARRLRRWRARRRCHRHRCARDRSNGHRPPRGRAAGGRPLRCAPRAYRSPFDRDAQRRAHRPAGRWAKLRMTEPTFFTSAAGWRAWLLQNHAAATELVVGFHKVSSGRGGMTYQEALDEALAFGWIDGRRGGGAERWTIRFTPRKPKSIWS